MAVYTIGDWRVKQGSEQQFVDAWREIASENTERNPGGWGKLLRDKDDPSHYTSVGEWRDESVVEELRSNGTFERQLSGIQAFMDDMSLHMFDLATEVGSVPTRV